jgi:hypothetical protein
MVILLAAVMAALLSGKIQAIVVGADRGERGSVSTFSPAFAAVERGWIATGAHPDRDPA